MGERPECRAAIHDSAQQLTLEDPVCLPVQLALHGGQMGGSTISNNESCIRFCLDWHYGCAIRVDLAQLGMRHGRCSMLAHGLASLTLPHTLLR